MRELQSRKTYHFSCIPYVAVLFLVFFPSFHFRVPAIAIIGQIRRKENEWKTQRKYTIAIIRSKGRSSFVARLYIGRHLMCMCARSYFSLSYGTNSVVNSLISVAFENAQDVVCVCVCVVGECRPHAGYSARVFALSGQLLCLIGEPFSSD